MNNPINYNDPTGLNTAPKNDELRMGSGTANRHTPDGLLPNNRNSYGRSGSLFWDGWAAGIYEHDWDAHNGSALWRRKKAAAGKAGYYNNKDKTWYRADGSPVETDIHGRILTRRSIQLWSKYGGKSISRKKWLKLSGEEDTGQMADLYYSGGWETVGWELLVQDAGLDPFEFHFITNEAEAYLTMLELQREHRVEIAAYLARNSEGVNGVLILPWVDNSKGNSKTYWSDVSGGYIEDWDANSYEVHSYIHTHVENVIPSVRDLRFANGSGINTYILTGIDYLLIDPPFGWFVSTMHYTDQFLQSTVPGYTEFMTAGGGIGGPTYSSGGVYVCFTSGTLVSTESGLVPIEMMKEGMSVYSYNFSKGSVELQPITNFIVREVAEIYEIQVGGELIRVTAEHPFYVKDKEWVKVKDLAKGDSLRTEQGREVEIVSSNKSNEKLKVYNIEVAGNHNYFVTSTRVLVHNKNVQELEDKQINCQSNSDNK